MIKTFASEDDVKNMEVPKRTLIRCAMMRYLAIMILPNGVRVWKYVPHNWTSSGGVTIGRLPEMSLNDAMRKCLRMSSSVDDERKRREITERRAERIARQWAHNERRKELKKLSKERRSKAAKKQARKYKKVVMPAVESNPLSLWRV